MTETVACPQCQRALSVPASLLGQLVKCPACSAAFTAGAATDAVAPSPPPAPPGAGGPPPRREERQSSSWNFDEDEQANRLGQRSLDFDPDREARPHRGGVVLALGILGMVFSWCPLLGWTLGGIAMSLGNSDLQEMGHGKMDRSGRGLTQAGKMLGTIAIAVSTLSCCLGIVFRVLRV